MKFFKSRSEGSKKAQDPEKQRLEAQRQRLRQFQMESASIIEDAISELEATRTVLEAPAAEELPEVEITVPVADFVVALDHGGNVINVVDVDDVEIEVPLDQKVRTIGDLVSAGRVGPGEVTSENLEDSTILAVGGKGLYLGAVWHGGPTPAEEDMTRGAWERALDFFDGEAPEQWSETDTLTLYNSVRASFGKDVMEIEGMAPGIGARMRTEAFDRRDLFAEIEALIEDLRRAGFSTTRLHEIRTMPTREAKLALDKFRSDLKLTRLLEARFYKLDAVDFPDESASIFSKLRSLAHLTEAAREIEELEAKVAEWEAQQRAQGVTADGFDVTVEERPGYDEIMTGVNQLEEEGYDVRFLYRMLYTGDLEIAGKALEYCRDNIRRLKAVEEELVKTWAEGYEENFEAIQARLTDPAMAATAERELKVLKARIKADTERERIFTLLRGKLDSWTEEGFNVEELRSVLTRDPDTIIETFKRFSNQVNFLVKLEDELNELETRARETELDLEEDLGRVREMLMDPSRATEIMDELRTLRYLISRRGDEDALREVIKTKVARWWEKGYDVAILQENMEQPIEVLEDMANEFEGFVKMLEDIERELDETYLEGFEEEEREIRDLLKDIRNISSARKAMKRLRANVGERIRREDRARASGDLEVGPPIQSHSLLGTVILRIGHRLPVALWGKDPGELAEDVLEAEYGKTGDGELILKIGRGWYYGDPRKEEQFLTPYTVGPSDDR